MRASVFDGRHFTVEDRPIPDIGEYEALVRVRTCGICGTDVHKAIHRTVKPPIVLGHEVSGDVIKVGSRVQKFSPGDRVVVPHHTPCLSCFFCHHGHPTLCEQYTKTNIDPGGFSEYIRVPQPNVERAMLNSGSLDYEEAAFVEPVACCIHAWERLRIFPGDTILVVGGGPIGLIHGELAKTYQGEVYIHDILKKRLEFAEKLGFTPYKSGEADIVIVAAGSAEAYEFALQSVRKGGQISFFAECATDSRIQVDPNLIYSGELTLTGSYSSTPFTHWMALSLIQQGCVRVKELITHRFGLGDVEKAIETAQKAECLKIMIKL